MSVRRSGQAAEFWALEELGRIRLSPTFYLRDFLYSELAAIFGLVNRPDDLKLAVETGRRLCDNILEPLQATFGRIHIRSGYRSAELNAFGHEARLKCARNVYTFADHIWDVRDEQGNAGACACVVIPWFQERFSGTEWPRLAWWIHDHLAFHRAVFFSKQTAFNIGWRDNPRQEISATLAPKGVLVGPSRPASLSPEERGALRGLPAVSRMSAALSCSTGLRQRHPTTWCHG